MANDAQNQADLLKHAAEQHVQPRICLDGLVKLLQLWSELFWVGVYMLDGVVEELVVVSLVLRQPVASLPPISTLAG